MYNVRRQVQDLLYITPGKLVNLPVLQFPHLYNWKFIIFRIQCANSKNTEYFLPKIYM